MTTPIEMWRSRPGRAAQAARKAAQAGLTAADILSRGLGVLDGLPGADALIAEAERRAGLARDASALREPLSILLRACEAEAELSLVGRLTVRWDAARLLRNLLRLAAAEAENLAILDERIERPIFITGLPRSGTTFLHKLLMLDPANQVPRIWETIDPYPRSRARAVRMVNRQLATFAWMAPGFRSLHPVDATSPQECSEITAHVFASLRFDTTYRIPAYRNWLDARGHVEAYRFHKRFLQHLQHRSGPRRWVLKCPDHVFALEAIREVYPDARVVFVNRDPLKVLASVATLTEVLRSPFTRRIDRLEIGAQESARWRAGAARMVQAARNGIFGANLLHVRYAELVGDPLASVQQLYSQLGLELGDHAAERIRQVTADEPHGGYGVNRHSFAAYGIDLEAELHAFAEYMSFFGVEREPTAPGQRIRPTPNPVLRPALP